MFWFGLFVYMYPFRLIGKAEHWEKQNIFLNKKEKKSTWWASEYVLISVFGTFLIRKADFKS